MKTFTSLFLAFLFIPFLHAQDETMARDMLIGGSVSFSSRMNSNSPMIFPINTPIFITGSVGNRTTGFSVSPYLGKMIKPGFTLGLELFYGYQKNTFEDTQIFGDPTVGDHVHEQNHLGVSIFSRHQLTRGGMFHIFLQPSLGFQSSKQQAIFNDSITTDDRKGNLFSASVDLGAFYQFNDRWRAIIQFGVMSYNTGKSEDLLSQSENDFNGFSTNLSLSDVRFGIELLL